MIDELIKKLVVCNDYHEVITELTKFIKKLSPAQVPIECLKELATAVDYAGMLAEDETVKDGFYLASYHQWGIHRPLTPLAPVQCVRTELIKQDKKRAAVLADCMGLQEFLIIQVMKGRANTFWI